MGINLLDSQQNHGFTLVELAIVLVIITSLLTLGLGALTSLLATGAYSETKIKQARIKDALIAYMGANKRLPCPDIPNNTNGTADSTGVTGNEDTATGVCTGTFGVFPFTTLGLGPDVATDGWGGFFSYQVYVDNPTPTCPGTGRNWTNAQCFGAGKAGGITIMEGAVPVANVVVVLVSHGPNGLRAWQRQGTQKIDPTTCGEEAHNSLATLGGVCTLTPNLFYKGERTENDDVVAYLTADDIIQSLSKQDAILSATAQVNDDLRKIVEDVKGQTLVQPSVISPSYTFTLPAGISNDPWGNPYRIVHNISSISNMGVVSTTGGATSAICIYSFGPNSANGTGPPTSIPTSTTSCTASGDDIAASVSVSALTTLLTNKACSPSC